MNSNIQEFSWEAAKVAGLPLITWLTTRWWQRRTLPFVEGLEVVLSQTKCLVSPEDGGPLDVHRQPAAEAFALRLQFINKSDKKVYLHHASLSELKPPLLVHPEALMDVGTDSYELKFRNAADTAYSEREVILDTNKAAVSVLPLAKEIDAFQPNRRRSMFQRLCRKHLWFCLKYSVTIGDSAFRVITRR